MKHKHKLLIGMLSILLELVAACGNSPEETTNSPSENQDQNDRVTQEESVDTAVEVPSKDSDSNNSTSNDTKDTSKNSPAEQEDPSATNTETSLKEEYLKKLNEAKKETDEMRNNPADDSTYALKAVEGEIYEVWDGLLNEIYGVLKQQLPSEEMNKLRDAQRKWIDYRDKTALEASLKYKGGTMEHLEYTVVLNNLTEERCFELVEHYMK
ncbi:lysozyme inhibitor LprI family protein [Ureibacillus sinduriensis]|uniref:Lysozyme inhibitor LprI-like N-terminal domain-containing protein n=1 Tax=Ureibacillus sinduriensis BLB-1 = JCM 15800 TaxID=1384057 RepID=A0A0A3IQK6_9BACL|nr:lysozyme inhibitor LprI family protein [Ureibacillus sinduriensis]KGR77112.1 hypothetical protein CD33_04200 [Ureibacillus sinduriensis BLB-1 = JCM 15800]